MDPLARLVLGRPRLVLVALLAITLAFAAFLPGLRISSDLRSLVPEGDPVVQELAEVVDEFGSQDVLMVVLSAPDVYRPSTLEKAWRIGQAIETIPGVASVVSPLRAQMVIGSESGIEVKPVATAPPATPDEITEFKSRLSRSPMAAPLISPDGTALAIVVTLQPGIAYDDDFARLVAPRLQRLVAEERGPESIELVGQPYLSYTIARSARRDLVVLLPLAVLVVLASLYSGLRTPLALFLPMVPVGMSLVWVLGLMTALHYRLSVVSGAMPVLLVVVGSASAIHILSRHQGLRREGLRHDEAVTRAMQALAVPLIMVSLTDAAGFASLVTSFAKPVREFGLFTAVGVLFSLLASLTAVPAILALRDPWHKLAGPAGGDRRAARGPGAGDGADRGRWATAMRALASSMVGPGGLVAIVAGMLLAAAGASGIPQVRIETDLLEYFGPQNEVVRSTRHVEGLFGGTSTLSVVVDTGQPDGVKDPALLARVERLQASLASMEKVAQVHSITDILRQVHRALNADDPVFERIPDTPQAVAQELLLFSFQGGSGLDSLVNYDYSKLRVVARVATLPTEQTRRLVQAFEAQARQAFAGLPVGIKVVGTPRIVIRLQERFVSSQIQSMTVAFGVVAAIVTASLRSWRFGLVSLLPLLLTVALQFGVMGYGAIPLDIATSMIAAIAIGVGVDYGIHLISRYRQERESGEPPISALEATLGSTGRAIVINALTLSAGFAVLIFSDFRAVSVLGILLALTMVVSAGATLFPLAASLVRMAEAAPTSARRSPRPATGKASGPTTARPPGS